MHGDGFLVLKNWKISTVEIGTLFHVMFDKNGVHFEEPWRKMFTEREISISVRDSIVFKLACERAFRS